MKRRKRLPFFALVTLNLLAYSLVATTLVVLADRKLTSEILFELQREKYDGVAATTVDEIDLYLQNVEETIRQNAMRVDDDGRSLKEVKNLFARTLTVRSQIYGAMVAFAPGREPEGEGAFQAFYAWRRGEIGSEIVFDENPVFNPEDDWFRLAFEQKKPIWTEPYDDVNGGVQMITYSCPILDENGEVEAVVTGDVSLDWIEKKLDALPLGRTGRPILFTKERSIFFKKAGAWENIGSLYDFAQTAKTPKEREERANFARRLEKEPSGQVRYRSPLVADKFVWLYYRTVGRTGWVVGCVLWDDQVLGIVSRVVFWISLIGFIGFVAQIFPAWFVSRAFSRRLGALAGAAGELAKGRFDAELPRTSKNVEIAKLTLAFKKMRFKLKRYIKNVTEMTKTKERVETQLNVARSIQRGIVPKNFEPAAEFGLDLFAAMEPAQEVGGDLYDFERLDEDRFYFCIGDVSGKGIPASLFMAVGKTLLKAEMLATLDPETTTTLANAELMKNNEAGLFITALGGYYDRSDRSVSFANAGHNPPVLFAPGEKPRYVDILPSFPLALVDETQYETQRIELPEGGRLLVYTDGVTDAVNVDGETFGSERLLDFLTGLTDLSSQAIVERLFAELKRFSEGAYQSDDVTALVFGPK